MQLFQRLKRVTGPVLSVAMLAAGGWAADSIGSGSIQGVVTDPSGAVIPRAEVTINNPVSHFKASATTDGGGAFSFHNVPFNPYHLTASADGFNVHEQDVDLRSSVPVNLTLTLEVSTGTTTVKVEANAEDLIESNPTAHTDIDETLTARLPIESVSSGLSSAITLATPGVVADSNGLFHPLGEHSDTSFSVDNQPINDQQSRTFSNQMSMNTIQSMEVISGVPPAEFGDKASLVIRTVTKSGLGAKPGGSVTLGYGSFGTPSAAAEFLIGNDKIGNFFSIDGLDSGRFLDAPEFVPIHAHGNSENIFDRIDFQQSPANAFHLNLGAARSWFQIPNDFDQSAAGQDQRQLVKSFNVAPGFTHLFNQTSLLSGNLWVRQDRVSYFPSADIFSDLPATLSQSRRLTSAGLRTDFSYVKGIHNLKGGFQFAHTFLSEAFNLGITDPTYNAVCLTAGGQPDPAPTPTDPTQCTFAANPAFQAGLLPYDLTRQGQLFDFHGRADIKQEAVYAQDSLTLKQLTLMAGLRFDNYNGLSSGTGWQPRVGGSYLIKRTSTVLRASYGRLFLTPYNENLILSSTTGSGGLATNVFGAFGDHPLIPARRSQFNVGFQQALSKLMSVDAEYFWKYTNDDFDFDVLFNTSLAFPIQWRKSKIDGFSLRLNFPEYHGLTAYSAMGHSRARFFGPEVGGIIFNSPVDVSVFRIDHDQAFQQNTHLQYQPKKNLPWMAFTWSYESGAVAGSVPDFATALKFTADQQAQIGLFCGSQVATLASPITSCSASRFGATRVRIPAPGTYNADTNPARIAPRHLFDAAVGMDNLLKNDKYKLDLRFTAINLTNDVALYNFLSTFSGTHFVAPRTYQAEMTFHF